MAYKSRQYYSDALFVARNYCAYGTYGGRPEKAVRYLMKKHPQHSKKVHLNTFYKCVALYQQLVELVNRHSDLFWADYNEKKAGGQASQKLQQLYRNEFTDHQVPSGLVVGTARWIFYWYHLR